MHGDAISGAIAGASESYNAQPGKPSHAFRAGGDRAAQLRTGDDKYKTGFAASLQRHRGRAAGFTTQGFADAKARSKNAAAHVATLQRDWEDYGRTGNLHGFASADALRTALEDAEAEQTSADKAQKRMESSLKQFGISTVREDGGISGFTSRAGYTARRAVGNTAGRAGRAITTAAESVPGLGFVVRSVDSARDNHRMHEIDRGQRADVVRTHNLDTNGNSADHSTWSNTVNTDRDTARTRRDSLDARGTTQSHIGDLADSVTGSAPGTHNGHIGRDS
jgi:hypothetical protein